MTWIIKPVDEWEKETVHLLAKGWQVGSSDALGKYVPIKFFEEDDLNGAVDMVHYLNGGNRPGNDEEELQMFDMDDFTPNMLNRLDPRSDEEKDKLIE